MPRGKKFTAEQIIGKPREAAVGLARGNTVPEVVRKLGATEQTYYRWKREYGGLPTDQANRLADLEKENARLTRLLADVELDNAIQREAASGCPQGSAATLFSPPKRCQTVEHVRDTAGRDAVTERRACQVLGPARNTSAFVDDGE